jgi:hypothetical protein
MPASTCPSSRLLPNRSVACPASLSVFLNRAMASFAWLGVSRAIRLLGCMGGAGSRFSSYCRRMRQERA